MTDELSAGTMPKSKQQKLGWLKQKLNSQLIKTNKTNKKISHKNPIKFNAARSSYQLQYSMQQNSINCQHNSLPPSHPLAQSIVSKLTSRRLWRPGSMVCSALGCGRQTCSLPSLSARSAVIGCARPRPLSERRFALHSACWPPPTCQPGGGGGGGDLTAVDGESNNASCGVCLAQYKLP